VRPVAGRALRPQVKAPRLLEAGGFALLDAVPGLAPPRALLDEALALARRAERQCHDVDGAEERRGGSPARRLFSSPGGPAQDHCYASRELMQSASDVVGARLRPSGRQGTYSYYLRPGDYLGLHRDIDECDVALITCLCDGAKTDGAGALRLYPRRLFEPLSRIRSTPHKGLLSLHLRPGQSIVLLGGYVPHATTAMTNGQKRIISVLCFRGSGWAVPVDHAAAS
jgi:hypothetical protein